MSTTFYRAPYLNPFLFDQKQIHNIFFYADGEVIATTKWFDNGGCNNNIDKMELPFEIKRSTKLNLNRTDAFYMVSKDATIWREYDVFIHKDLVNLTFIGRKETAKFWNYTQWADFYSVNIPHFVKGNAKETLTFTTNFKCIDTDEGKKVDKMTADINKVIGYDKVSSYDVRKLMGVFDITPKKEK